LKISDITGTIGAAQEALNGSGSVTQTYSSLDTFTESIPFVIFFLVMVAFISMVFGQDALTGFLILILMSMLVFNQGRLEQLLGYIKF
jgi:uncharacterized protein (DUF486 family)